MKMCPKCKETKPYECFGKRLDRKSGIQSWCKVCQKIERRGASGRASRDRWLYTDHKRRLLQNSKDRAKKTGVEWNLTKEDFELPTHCPVLGLELKYEKGPREDRSASLDRLDNNRGYVPGNVFVVSWRVNALKKDATLDELKKIAAYIENHQ